MKSCKQLVVVAIFAALAVAGLNAQVVDMRASIPFDFHAGNTFMPAGEYRIHGQDSVVFVRGADTGTPVSILMTNSVAGRGPAHDARTGARRCRRLANGNWPSKASFQLRPS
jgi:hypothetical protein